MKSLKSIIYVFLLSILFNSIIAAQSKPEKIYPLVIIHMPTEWYAEQAELWNEELKKNPKNPDCYNNVYLAVRYANPPFGSSIAYKNAVKRLCKIAEENIPDSYMYYYLKDHLIDTGFFNINRDISYLEKAYNLQPDNQEVLYNILVNLIVHYELARDREKSEKYCKKLYESKLIPSGFLDYNYNVLMSVEENAILFTNGDMDTFPIWVLQHAKGIRKDVSVLNVSVTRSNDYEYLEKLISEKGIDFNLKKLLKKNKDITNSKNQSFYSIISDLCNAILEEKPDIPLYFAPTIPESVRKSICDDVNNLYNTGLAQRYSKNKIENIGLLRKNIERKFRLDYLTNDWYTESDVSAGNIQKLNGIYNIAFIPLYEHYKASGEESKALYYKELILLLTSDKDRENIKKYLEKD
ncbi:hypothetical protein ACFL40_00480 [candidate division KSB1 bacterium]